MVTYNGINHLAMATCDMDMTIGFWRDLLGMRLVAGIGHPGYRHYFFEISRHDLIAFFEWPHVEKIPEKEHGAPVKGPLAFDHVSIGVESQNDLWQLKQRLEGAGFWVSEMIDHGFIYSIYAHDPNNIPIEFSCSVEGVDIRKKPQMVDTQPTFLALEGPEPSKTRWPEKYDDVTENKKVYPGDGVILRKK